MGTLAHIDYRGKGYYRFRKTTKPGLGKKLKSYQFFSGSLGPKHKEFHGEEGGTSVGGTSRALKRLILDAKNTRQALERSGRKT